MKNEKYLGKTIKKSFLSCQGSRPIFRPWKKSFKQFNIFPAIQQMNFIKCELAVSPFSSLWAEKSVFLVLLQRVLFFRFFEVESFEPVANCAQKCPPFFGIR
jgi:hypothetical protein